MNAFILIPVLALTALGIGSSQARAANGSMSADAPAMTVRFADLDLTKPQDAAVLYQRIRFAARLVCNTASSPWDGSQVRNWARCFNSAVEEAVLRVDRPALTALYRERTKPANG
jgi:UrcA family protein